MHPKIFLSHSKKDKLFIEKLANDLQKSGIDVWYDEWEIPVGESIRRKIFEEGITECDLFFVYLTENSIPSYWVQEELDGALIHEIEKQHSFLALFVNNDDSRNRLSIDLKARNIPVFNDKEYLISFGKLLTKTWQSYTKSEIKEKAKDAKLEILELQKKNSDLEKNILQLQSNQFLDVDLVKEKLEKVVFKFEKKEKDLFEILMGLKNELADGANEYYLLRIITERIFNIGFDIKNPDIKKDFEKKFRFSDFSGELIINGLLEIKTSRDLDQFYYLTKQGIEFVARVTTTNKDE